MQETKNLIEFSKKHLYKLMFQELFKKYISPKINYQLTSLLIFSNHIRPSTKKA